MKSQDKKQTIVVNLNTWRKLRNRKLGPGETFDTAINGLFDEVKELRKRKGGNQK